MICCCPFTRSTTRSFFCYFLISSLSLSHTATVSSYSPLINLTISKVSDYWQGLEDVFTYPWTSQSYRPARPLQFGYQQGQVKPPSAATAPPFVYYTSKGDHYPKGDKQPPYSAPVKPVLSPLLSAQPSDRRLRRRDRRKPEAITTVTDLATIPEVQEDVVLPLDSISHVLPAVRPFDPDSLRLRSVDNAAVMDLRSEFGTSWPRRAMSTPRGRAWDADGFPQTPTRIFKGEYMDPCKRN